MPNDALFPLTETLVALATLTTNTTSAVFTLPPANSYRFCVEVNTVSGTSPTMQVILASSSDSTTYQEIMSFTQITTTGLGRQGIFRPYLGVGDAATEGQIGLLGTTDMASAADVKHGPINPQYMKARFVFGGTSPSFAVVLKVYCQPKGGYSGMG